MAEKLIARFREIGWPGVSRQSNVPSFSLSSPFLGNSTVYVVIFNSYGDKEASIYGYDPDFMWVKIHGMPLDEDQMNFQFVFKQIGYELSTIECAEALHQSWLKAREMPMSSNIAWQREIMYESFVNSNPPTEQEVETAAMEFVGGFFNRREGHGLILVI